MTATGTRTPKREPLSVLLSVRYDHAASTSWHELWQARSDSRVGLTLDVRYDVVKKVWTCDAERCPGFRHHGHCHHCLRCDRMRRIRWWSAMLAGQPPALLRAERDRRRERVAGGGADDDDFACLDYLALELGEQRAA